MSTEHKHIFVLSGHFVARNVSLSLSLSLCQERRMMQMHPYILNINEDAQLSGVVKLFIQEGKSVCLSFYIEVNGGCREIDLKKFFSVFSMTH